MSKKIIGNLKSKIVFLVLIAFCIFNMGPASGQESKYPDKPIQVLVSFGPGGTVDVCTRTVSEALSQELGVPLLIKNKAGAGGMIGAADVLKEAPDGYTILATSTGAMTSAPIESANPPYEPLKDFKPICGYGISPMIFGAIKSSPLNNLKEVVEQAKKNPGKLTCGVTSIGGENHLNVELFKKAANIDIKIIPYKGTGEAIAALLGGHLDMMVLTYVGFLPYVESDQARILAITKKFPDTNIPSISEVGYPQVRMDILMGFWVSSDVPEPIYEKLVAVFTKVLNHPDISKKLQERGILFEFSKPADFTNDLKERYDMTTELVKELGLKK